MTAIAVKPATAVNAGSIQVFKIRMQAALFVYVKASTSGMNEFECC